LQDIDEVNRRGVNRTDRHSQGAFADSCGKYFSLFSVEQLAVVQAPQWAGGIKHNGSGNYRAEKTPSADLVDPGDRVEALSPRLALVLRIGL